jgi:predicted nucleic-acid-binding Zn-ribbon protein
MSFNEQELLDALDAKGAGAECPSCGKTNWTISEQLAAIPLAEGSGPTIDVEQGVEAYCLVCNNCGFIRLHHRKTLTGD